MLFSPTVRPPSPFPAPKPLILLSGELENAGKRGPGGKEKEWTDCVADDLRLFGVTGDWKTAALDPGAWYNTVQEGGLKKNQTTPRPSRGL